jgi:tetratricopeptide (TPR) repeat protein
LFTVSKLFFLVVLFGGGALAAEKGLSPQTQRAIRESENLSLLKDRLQACTVLNRTIKKSNPQEAPLLREKLTQLAKYFYTDKGFQDYLLGKELFEKQKYADAVEKLAEADELEKGNVDVLHYLGLSQLWLKKLTLADAVVKRALIINPFDIEILRDQLSISCSLENWDEALKTGQSLNKDFSDTTALTLYFFGLANIQLGSKEDGEKLMNEALAKDSNLPEPYFYLGGTKFETKYFELCSVKAPRVIERDPNSCIHLDEARKAMVAPKSTVAPTPAKKDHP